jgi:hypothetical protein
MKAPINVQTVAHVGLALSVWSQVEMTMTYLFSLISGMEGRKAIAMFDGIISFEVRLSILDTMMGFEKVDEVEAEMWQRMSSRLTKAYKKRHELAHFRLIGSDEGLAISPFLTHHKLLANTQKTLSRAQIKERNHRFFAIDQALTWFIDQADRRRSPNGTGLRLFDEEPPYVAQLRALAIQTLEERKRQKKRAPQEDEWGEPA